MKIQIDIDGTISGNIGTILSYGNSITGNNVYDIPINDYSPSKYKYNYNGIPLSVNDFILIESQINNIDYNEIDKVKQDIDVRLIRINELLAYMNIVLSENDYKNFYISVRTLKQDYIDGYPSLIHWINNSRDDLWGINYNMDSVGFKSKSYYSTTLRDNCLKILNINH